MQRLYVVAFPEMAAQDAVTLEALRAAHDPVGHAMLKAHFTFVFGCASISREVAKGAMQSVAGEFGTIEFCLSRAILSMHGGLHCVFLCPDRGATEMLDVHSRLHEGPLAGCLDPGQQFTPHLTVCKTADAEQARDVLAQLNQRALRTNGRLRSLSLGFIADGKFKVVAQAPLARANRT
jgi:hypothetical protein